ncbi:MAG: hypothetical protein Tsb0021_07500 [Chlamydiales bacterium]
MISGDFYRQIPVFSQKQAEQVRSFHHSQDGTSFLNDEINHRKVLKGWEGLKEKCVVQFDESGKVVSENLTRIHDEQGFLVLLIIKVVRTFRYAAAVAGFCSRPPQKLAEISEPVKKALETTARELKWNKAHRRRMSISLIHHKLEPGIATRGIEWHYDGSQNTLVILLDEKNWEGGDFLFAPDRKSKEKYKKMTPLQGYGVLFSNQFSAHRVTKIDQVPSSCTRTIFTLHDFGEVV